MLAPEFSIVSRTDSNVYGHLKGFLNLPFKLRLQAGSADEDLQRMTGLIPPRGRNA